MTLISCGPELAYTPKFIITCFIKCDSMIAVSDVISPSLSVVCLFYLSSCCVLCLMSVLPNYQFLIAPSVSSDKKFADTKRAIRNRKSKVRNYNVQNSNVQRTNNTL